MNSEKTPRPIVAFCISLIGGILAFLIGFFRFLSLLGPSCPIIPLFFIVYGFVLTIGSAMIYKHPKKHRDWGIRILILSIGVGFLGVLQSFILRSLLFPRAHAIDPSIEILIVLVGVLAGISSIVWKPAHTPTAA